MSAIDKEGIARITEEYGGSWGINHTRRLLHLIDLIGEVCNMTRMSSGWQRTCTTGARTNPGSNPKSTTYRDSGSSGEFSDGAGLPGGV